MRLRRSRASDPGISRVRCGRGFRYVDPDGKPVRDPDVVARITSLVLPPAWEQVWICSDAAGHLQATGLDSAGRRQYRYHDHWRSRRDSDKHRRMLDFAVRCPVFARPRPSTCSNAGSDASGCSPGPCA